MANTPFTVPSLRDAGAFIQARDWDSGGFGWYGDLNLRNVRAVVMHHSVTARHGNADQEIRDMIHIHRVSRGWGGVGYNFIVTTEEVNGFAKVAYIGDIGSIRAHTPNRKGFLGIPAQRGNQQLISICFVGRFDGDHGNPSDAQLRSAHELAKELMFHEDGRLPGIPNDWNQSLFGHKDFDYTACPGEFPRFRDLIIHPPAQFVAPEPEPTSVEPDPAPPVQESVSEPEPEPVLPDPMPQLEPQFIPEESIPQPELVEWKDYAVRSERAFTPSIPVSVYDLVTNEPVHTVGAGHTIKIMWRVGNYYVTEGAYKYNVPQGYKANELEAASMQGSSDQENAAEPGESDVLQQRVRVGVGTAVKPAGAGKVKIPKRQ